MVATTVATAVASESAIRRIHRGHRFPSDSTLTQATDSRGIPTARHDAATTTITHRRIKDTGIIIITFPATLIGIEADTRPACQADVPGVDVLPRTGKPYGGT